MQTNPAVEQNKNIKWPKSISPVGLLWKGFAKEPSLKARMKDRMSV